MASAKKKGGGKSKGKTMNLTEWLQNEDGTAPNPVTASTTSWADEMDNVDHDDGDEVRVTFDRSKLPTAPKAARGPDFDVNRISDNKPFTAFVGNLPYDVSEEKIEQFFEGRNLQVEGVRLPSDNGRQRGFGYVEFVTKEDLVAALSFNEEMFDGRKIRVDLAETSGGDRERGDRDGMGRSDRSEWRGGGGDPDRTEGDWRRRDGPPPSIGGNDRGGGGGFGDRDRDGFGDRDRDRGGFGDRDRGGFGDRDRGGFGDRDRGGFGDRDRGGFGDRDRDGGSRGGGFSNRDGERRGGGFGSDRGGGFDRESFGDRGSRYSSERDGGGGGGGRSRTDDDYDWRGGNNRREGGGGGGGAFSDRRNDRFDDRQGGGGNDRYGDRRGGFGGRSGYDERDRGYGGRREGGYRRDEDRERGGSREERVASREGSQDGPKERPRLNLKPRTAPVEASPKEQGRQSSIFGSARPVDTATKEREIEEKMKKLDTSAHFFSDDAPPRDREGGRGRRDSGGGRERKLSSSSGNSRRDSETSSRHSDEQGDRDRRHSGGRDERKMVPAPPPKENAWSKPRSEAIVRPAEPTRQYSSESADSDANRRDYPRRQSDEGRQSGHGGRGSNQESSKRPEQKSITSVADCDRKEKIIPKSIEDMPKLDEGPAKNWADTNKFALIGDDED